MTLSQLRMLVYDTSSKQMIHYILDYLQEQEDKVLSPEEHEVIINNIHSPFGDNE